MWRKGVPDTAGLTQGVSHMTLVYARHGPRLVQQGTALNKGLEVL